MKIKDILGLVDENCQVSIVDADNPDTVIAWYDGKNSIPKGLNPCEIQKIRVEYSVLYLEI